jgi:hypothetical protein
MENKLIQILAFYGAWTILKSLGKWIARKDKENGL